LKRCAKSLEIFGESQIAIAGKPAPTGFLMGTKFVNTEDHCGSGLARDAGASVYRLALKSCIRAT
jgi:hypothetical protein